MRCTPISLHMDLGHIFSPLIFNDVEFLSEVHMNSFARFKESPKAQAMGIMANFAGMHILEHYAPKSISLHGYGILIDQLPGKENQNDFMIGWQAFPTAGSSPQESRLYILRVIDNQILQIIPPRSNALYCMENVEEFAAFEHLMSDGYKPLYSPAYKVKNFFCKLSDLDGISGEISLVIDVEELSELLESHRTAVYRFSSKGMPPAVEIDPGKYKNRVEAYARRKTAQYMKEKLKEAMFEADYAEESEFDLEQLFGEYEIDLNDEEDDLTRRGQYESVLLENPSERFGDEPCNQSEGKKVKLAAKANKELVGSYYQYPSVSYYDLAAFASYFERGFIPVFMDKALNYYLRYF